jgi:hypothetical protein
MVDVCMIIGYVSLLRIGTVATRPHITVVMCYRQKLTWSIWAKKRAAIKMGFEDNHD